MISTDNAHQRLQVSLIGGRRHNTTESNLMLARSFGRELARRGHILISGADDGTASEASLGAGELSGIVVGVHKGDAPVLRLAFVTVDIGTRMDVSRGALLAYSADVVCAFPGSFGTIAEVGVALDVGRPVVFVNWWPFSDTVLTSSHTHRFQVNSEVEVLKLIEVIEGLGRVRQGPPNSDDFVDGSDPTRQPR